MTREEFEAVTPSNFDNLSAGIKQEAIAYNDLYVRIYHGACLQCGLAIDGTLIEIKGKPCPACGYGSATE